VLALFIIGSYYKTLGPEREPKVGAQDQMEDWVNHSDIPWRIALMIGSEVCNLLTCIEVWIVSDEIEKSGDGSYTG
jgi:hypothetical protein